MTVAIDNLQTQENEKKAIDKENISEKEINASRTSK